MKETQHILSSSQVEMYVTLETVMLFGSPTTVFNNGSERQLNIYTCIVLLFILSCFCLKSCLVTNDIFTLNSVLNVECTIEFSTTEVVL